MAYTAAVITISDKGSRGERVDTSGPALCKILAGAGWNIVHTSIVPDEMDQIKSELIACADNFKIDLVLTTGGTGFSPRDITPEATMAVIERHTPGIPEAMRAESLRITPKGCLSRAESGIRGGSLIVNLPGSEKAAVENLNAVLGALEHGVDMLRSAGSADCAEQPEKPRNKNKEAPSVDQWLKEAKADPRAAQVGMFLTHNGTVRQTARAKVRNGDENTKPVTGLNFSYDEEKVKAVIEDAYKLEGVYYIRVWLNEGELDLGDDIMYVLVGGDIRPRTVDALQYIVGRIKGECVSETELN